MTLLNRIKHALRKNDARDKLKFMGHEARVMLLNYEREFVILDKLNWQDERIAFNDGERVKSYE